MAVSLGLRVLLRYTERQPLRLRLHSRRCEPPLRPARHDHIDQQWRLDLRVPLGFSVCFALSLDLRVPGRVARCVCCPGCSGVRLGLAGCIPRSLSGRLGVHLAVDLSLDLGFSGRCRVCVALGFSGRFTRRLRSGISGRFASRFPGGCRVRLPVGLPVGVHLRLPGSFPRRVPGRLARCFPVRLRV